MQLRRSLLPLMAALAFSACSDEAEDAEKGSTEAIDPIEAPAGQQWSEIVQQTDEGGYVMGNPDAPIRLVEYMSLTCPHCADFGEDAYAPLRDEYVNSGRVSFEIRNFVRDPIDLTSAILTRCGTDGSYFALTEAALGDQEDVLTQAQAMQQQGFFAQLEQTPPEERPMLIASALGMIDTFKARGLSEDQQKTCLADMTKITALTNGTAQASSEFNIQGTPSFLINGRLVDVSNWQSLQNLLQQAGAR